MKSWKILAVVMAVLLCFTACGETLPENHGEKPYLKSESTVAYNNAPVIFEFQLNGYDLTVSGENLSKGDYKISRQGVLSINAEFFERENKREYTFSYSLSYLDDVITGTLTVTSTVWGEVDWH